MQYFTPYGTDLKMSRIIFGGWAAGGWHWGGADDAETLAAVDASLEAGINTFDTAPVYGFGHSEKIIGAALGRHKRSDFVILTKCGLRWDNSDGVKFFETERSAGDRVEVYRNLRRASIVQECEKSLERLSVETIDIYQIHWPDVSVMLEEAARAFEDLRTAGKIRYAGVSNFTIEMMMEWKKLCSVPLVTDQERYSLLARKMESSNLQYTRKHKISMLAYGPLAQGLLTGKVTADRKFASGDERAGKTAFSTRRRESVLAALEKVRPTAERLGISACQLALRWVLSTPGISGALAGIRRADQARENAGAGDALLTPDEWTFVAEALAVVPPL